MTKVLQPIFLIVSLFFSIRPFAQATNWPASNAAGGTAVFTNCNISWNLGEAMPIELLFTANTHTGTTVENSNWKTSEISVKSVSGANKAQVIFTAAQKGKVFMGLYDEMGRLLYNKQFEYSGKAVTETINLTPFPRSQFFLKVSLNPVTGSEHKKGVYKIQNN